MKQIDRIEKKIDDMDAKLDNHLGRLVGAEHDISWLKGHLKVTISIGLALLGAALTYIVNTLD